MRQDVYIWWLFDWGHRARRGGDVLMTRWKGVLVSCFHKGSYRWHLSLSLTAFPWWEVLSAHWSLLLHSFNKEFLIVYTSLIKYNYFNKSFTTGLYFILPKHNSSGSLYLFLAKENMILVNKWLNVKCLFVTKPM